MSEIKLVTLNDEPALALGEFLLSEDGETLYVGSGTVQSGTEVIYIGRSPAQIKSGVFSRLPVVGASIKVEKHEEINVRSNITKQETFISKIIEHNYNPNIAIELKEVL